MRTIREVAEVNMMVTMRVIVGELRNLEDEFEKMEPREFLAAWLPEVTGVKLFIKIKEKDYARCDPVSGGRKTKSNRPVQQPLQFGPKTD